MGKDYYKILGITDEERKLKGEEFKKVLKKKYRKLAAKYHPDKNQGDKSAEEKFKEVTTDMVLQNIFKHFCIGK